MSKLLAAVIRFSGVRQTKTELETMLGRGVSHFEDGYGQIDLEDDWVHIEKSLSACTPQIGKLLKDELVDSAELHIGFVFGSDIIAPGAIIPASIASMSGQHGINIAVSLYPSLDDEES